MILGIEGMKIGHGLEKATGGWWRWYGRGGMEGVVVFRRIVEVGILGRLVSWIEKDDGAVVQ